MLFRGCAVDGKDQVFVSDQENYRIKVFNRNDGTFIRSFGSRGIGPGKLKHTICGFRFETRVHMHMHTGEFTYPRGLLLTPSNEVVVCDAEHCRILVTVCRRCLLFLCLYGNLWCCAERVLWQMFDENGNFLRMFDKPGTTHTHAHTLFSTPSRHHARTRRQRPWLS